MVRKCPCKGMRCVCHMDGTAGLTWSGNGSLRQPYVPEWELWTLEGEDNEQANTDVTGDGSAGDPFVMEVNTLGGIAVQTVYESDGTWIRPQSGNVVQVVVIGGGGGGGSAAPDATAGGSGGAGGAMSVGWFLMTDLPDEIDIKVGQGGAHGRPIAGETTAGNGGRSYFGQYLGAMGGKGGTSQAAASQTQHTTLGGTPPEGGPGGAGSVRSSGTGVDAEDHTSLVSPTGGGMGSGTVVNGAPLGNAHLAGDLTMHTWAGRGGQGGNTSTIGPTEWPGVDGNKYGGGGGGGGSTSTDAWRGGDGAQGVVVVTVW